MNIQILETDIDTAASVSILIPELIDPHFAEEYHRRMDGKTFLSLIAYADGKPAGFKVGYDKFGDGSFYSWMGGVLPAYRGNHIAKALAERQENRAKAQGSAVLFLKPVTGTRQCYCLPSPTGSRLPVWSRGSQ